MNAQRIEKQILLHAPRERVWSAISDSAQFGSWFGADLNGPFEAGKPLKGKIVPTTVDAEIAKLQKPHEGKTFEIVVGDIVPMEKFSFLWHPFAVEAGVDYSNEPMTLVSFRLQDVLVGTRLTITETGFEQIPEARRAAAISANDGGWAKQIELIQKYLAMHEKDTHRALRA